MSESHRSPPLHVAVGMADLETVSVLLQAGADVNVTEPSLSRTPLHFVIEVKENIETAIADQVAAALIQAGANINARDRRLYTPLHFAAEHPWANTA
jgi:ankyrin repeat protein